MEASAQDVLEGSALWFSHQRWEDHAGEREVCALTGQLAHGEALRHSAALGSLNYITSETAYSPGYGLAEVTETRNLNKRNPACFCMILAVRGYDQ